MTKKATTKKTETTKKPTAKKAASEKKAAAKKTATKQAASTALTGTVETAADQKQRTAGIKWSELPGMPAVAAASESDLLDSVNAMTVSWREPDEGGETEVTITVTDLMEHARQVSVREMDEKDRHRKALEKIQPDQEYLFRGLAALADKAGTPEQFLVLCAKIRKGLGYAYKDGRPSKDEQHLKPCPALWKKYQSMIFRAWKEHDLRPGIEAPRKKRVTANNPADFQLVKLDNPGNLESARRYAEEQAAKQAAKKKGLPLASDVPEGQVISEKGETRAVIHCTEDLADLFKRIDARYQRAGDDGRARILRMLGHVLDDQGVEQGEAAA